LTREEMEALRDYLDASFTDASIVDGTYEVKLTRVELESIISALDEVIHF
jgi:hypothetical protein